MGRNRQAFFDIMQGMLEKSLESLNHKNEEDWQVYLDCDEGGLIHIGERFTKYKEECNSLKELVETHFSKCINQIEAGLPEVYDVLTKAGEFSLSVDDMDTWTCPVCTTVNKKEQVVCPICHTKKPKGK